MNREKMIFAQSSAIGDDEWNEELSSTGSSLFPSFLSIFITTMAYFVRCNPSVDLNLSPNTGPLQYCIGNWATLSTKYCFYPLHHCLNSDATILWHGIGVHRVVINSDATRIIWRNTFVSIISYKIAECAIRAFKSLKLLTKYFIDSNWQSSLRFAFVAIFYSIYNVFFSSDSRENERHNQNFAMCLTINLMSGRDCENDSSKRCCLPSIECGDDE